MKQVVVPRTRLAGLRDMDGALHAVFGPGMLRKMHGPGTRVGPFEHDKRVFKFKVSVDAVPLPIRRFFCGSELGVTTRQGLERGADKYTVTNRLKFHFVGAELFKLRPVFWLERERDGGISLGGIVGHTAVLPPPLNGIAENFMRLHTRRELLHFAKCLHEEGLVEAEVGTELPR
jgi:hypothetical protein